MQRRCLAENLPADRKDAICRLLDLLPAAYSFYTYPFPAPLDAVVYRGTIAITSRALLPNEYGVITAHAVAHTLLGHTCQLCRDILQPQLSLPAEIAAHELAFRLLVPDQALALQFKQERPSPSSLAITFDVPLWFMEARLAQWQARRTTSCHALGVSASS